MCAFPLWPPTSTCGFGDVTFYKASIKQERCILYSEVAKRCYVRACVARSFLGGCRVKTMV